MNNTQQLPGLFITDDKASALEAMFSRNFDVVILRHPDPVAFEAAMRQLCTAQPELITPKFTYRLTQDPFQTNFIDAINQLKATAASSTTLQPIIDWFATLKEVADRGNPTFPTTECSTRSIYNGTYSPFFGYHRDRDHEVDANTPIAWRSVMTLVGAGTKIIEERKLKPACRRDNPAHAEATRIAEAEFPSPPTAPVLVQKSGQSRKAFRIAQRRSNEARAAFIKKNPDVEIARLRRAARREEIVLSGIPVVSAQPGDMVFISMVRPKHLFHGSPQYAGGMRLGLVLDHR